MNHVVHQCGRTSTVSLMTAIMLIAGNANVLAADHVASRSVTQIPLKASTNPDIIRTLTRLRKQAEGNRTVRIIVGVRVAFAPEGTMDAASVAQQRNEIAGMQSVVLDKVPSLKQRPETIKRFDSIPFMAMEVNAAALEALASLTEITSIEEDSIAAPTLGNGIAIPETK